MASLSRRKLLRASMGVAAAGILARPYIANAQAKTAQVWWAQGFVPEEDDAFRRRSPITRRRAATRSTTASCRSRRCGKRSSRRSPAASCRICAPSRRPKRRRLQAWQDKLVDVSDVVETQKAKMLPASARRRPLLQQRREAAQLLCGAAERRGHAVPCLGHAWSRKRDTSAATCPRPGTPSSTSSSRSRRSCKSRACATPMPPALSSARSATTRTRPSPSS